MGRRESMGDRNKEEEGERMVRRSKERGSGDKEQAKGQR